MAVRRRSNGVVCFVMNEMLATPVAVRGGARVAFKSRKMAFGGRILHPNRGTQSVFVLNRRRSGCTVELIRRFGDALCAESGLLC
jgi:hypothetical protein